MAKEHSFDISAEIDKQKFKDAYEQAKKVITNRWDFKGITCEFEHNEKAKTVTLLTTSDSKADANGTTARKYYNDLAKDTRFRDAYRNSPKTDSSSASVNMPAPSYQKADSTNSQSVVASSRMPSPVVATPTVSTPPAPPRPPQMASTAAVPDTKVEPPAPVAVAASGGGASGVAAQGVSQHLSNPTIAHIVTGGIGFRG